MERFDYCYTLGTRFSCPFGGKFDLDPWVAFHGTSNVCESLIDSGGLSAASQSYTRKNLADLCAIYQQMHWAGEDIDGFAVLSTFSASDYDRGDGTSKTTHLAATSYRALIYAMPSRAGGEAAMAVRYAFRDLDEVLKKPSELLKIREAAWRGLRSGFRPPYPPGCAPDPGKQIEFCHLHAYWKWRRRNCPGYSVTEPREVTDDWPRLELARLRVRLGSCLAAVSNWSYGVIYVVRLDETFAPMLSNGPAGLASKVLIPKSYLIAKAVIPPEVFDHVSVIHLRSQSSRLEIQRERLPIFGEEDTDDDLLNFL